MGGLLDYIKINFENVKEENTDSIEITHSVQSKRQLKGKAFLKDILWRLDKFPTEVTNI